MSYAQQPDNLSFFVDDDEKSMLPLNRNQDIVRVFPKNNKKSSHRTSNGVTGCINVLRQDHHNSGLQVNTELLDHLVEDETNPDLIIATFIGPKKVGKSFLIDCLISHDKGSVTREMSSNSKPFLNTSAVEIRGKNGQKILYIDSDGLINNKCFLWSYIVSSVIVLNLNPKDKNGQELFLSHLSFVQSHLDSDPEQLTLPQLIILRRDTDSRQFDQRQLLKRIEQFNLFQPDISTFKMNYPGSSSVNAKELINVPESSLNPVFLKQVDNLEAYIKLVSPKYIRGNPMGAKVFTLMAEPLTKSLNKDSRLSTQKIWDNVIQSISVGYYNFYYKKYFQELKDQFSDQKPYDRYTLYKKLSAIRRRIDKKVQGFNNISNDPIFEKYKEALDQKIKARQKLIKDVNRQKSLKKNNQLCQQLFQHITPDNCVELIQDYCRTQLDDEKSDVLLENLEKIMKTKPIGVARKVKSKELQKLQKKAGDLNKRSKTIRIGDREYDYDQLTKSIADKQRELKSLEVELEKQRESVKRRNNTQHEEITKLEREVQTLKTKISEQDLEMAKLKEEREKQSKEATDEIQKQLREEEDKLAKLEELLKKRKEQDHKKPGKEQSKSCCQIM